jgi:hypothetical protein
VKSKFALHRTFTMDDDDIVPLPLHLQSDDLAMQTWQTLFATERDAAAISRPTAIVPSDSHAMRQSISVASNSLTALPSFDPLDAYADLLAYESKSADKRNKLKQNKRSRHANYDNHEELVDALLEPQSQQSEPNQRNNANKSKASANTHKLWLCKFISHADSNSNNPSAPLRTHTKPTAAQRARAAAQQIQIDSQSFSYDSMHPHSSSTASAHYTLVLTDCRDFYVRHCSGSQIEKERIAFAHHIKRTSTQATLQLNL